MCEKCNRNHLNVQTTVRHEIISIRSTQDYPGTPTHIVTEHIPCDRHKKKDYIKYCLECCELICEDCINKIHREHELEEIKDGCDFIIVNTQARLSKDLWFCENESKQLKTSSGMCNSSYNNARKKIDVREKEMKEDMSLAASKDILLSLYNSTVVSLLTTKTGEIKPFLSLSPLCPRCIHVT